MDEYNDLDNAIGNLSVKHNGLELDENVQMELKKIENGYESIFSWNIINLTGICENLMLDLINKVQEKYEMIVDKENEFNINKFYLRLIISFEFYTAGKYEESLLEIENLIKFMNSCKFDEVDKQYSDAFYHIAQATNAYIALTLNRDFEKIMESIKPVSCLNRAERSVICAIKAKMFMEYPPKGNDIALKFADQACCLYSTESEWILIWLKAKGRVRRYYNQYKMPEADEIDAAETLSTTKTKPQLLIKASKVYVEIAFINKLNNNYEESEKYYKLSSELTMKAVNLAKDNIKHLYSCLTTYIDYPKQFHSKTILDELIKKLTNVQNSRVDQVLGKYYLKHEKDYKKAKMYLSRAMAYGHFNSSLQLIKVECLMQPINSYPLIKTLNMLYDIFVNPKRRLIILSQILIYYNYFESDPKELMHYLKLYMDQDISDSLKKRHLVFAYPLFKVKGVFRNKQFFNILSVKVNNILKDHLFNTEEKEIINDTFNRFNKIIKVNINDNVSKTHLYKHHDNNSDKTYFEKTQFDGRNNEHYWRKKENNFSMNNPRSNPSKNTNQKKPFQRHTAINMPKQQNKLNDNHFNKTSIKPDLSHESKNDFKDPNNIELKKSENHNSLSNLHIVVKGSTNKPINRFRSNGRNNTGCKFNYKNQQDGIQNQNVCSYKKNSISNNNSQYIKRRNNTNWKNRQCEHEKLKNECKSDNHDPSNNNNLSSSNNPDDKSNKDVKYDQSIPKYS